MKEIREIQKNEETRKEEIQKKNGQNEKVTFLCFFEISPLKKKIQ